LAIRAHRCEDEGKKDTRKVKVEEGVDWGGDKNTGGLRGRETVERQAGSFSGYLTPRRPWSDMDSVRASSCRLVTVRKKTKAAQAFVSARDGDVDAGFRKALAMRPIMARNALGPIVHVGIGVVVDLVAVGAVLVFLIAQSAGVAEVQYLALDEAVTPQRRIRGVAVGALVIVQTRSRLPLVALLV
jgi:hypothetical protein